MADEEKPLSLLSQEEVEEQLKPEQSGETTAGKPYAGPERRSGKDRRSGPRDRREMLRFEPEKDRADRRGRDRRKANNGPDDLWKQRDT